MLITYLSLFGLGLLLGAIAVYFYYRKKEKEFIELKVKCETQEQAVKSFQALSGESLKSNNQAFLELAKETLGSYMKDASGDIGKKEEAIKGLLRPLEDSLKRYENHIREAEKARFEHYGQIGNQIKNLMQSQESLQKETHNLVTALRRPEIRGKWGESTLKRVVEVAGMSEHCDYSEQISINTEDGRLRPDMVIHLPGNKNVVIDSKVSLDAYLNAIGADDENIKKEMLEKHAQQVRKHMRGLASKAYFSQFENSPEFVVMFLPGESFYSAAVQNDKDLIDDGMKLGVIIATPSLLMALLKTIAFGWQQEQIAQNAKQIADLAKELYERFQPFLEHYDKLGKQLSQTIESFNKMGRSLENRVMVTIKKFQELGAGTDKDLPEIPQIDKIPITSLSVE